MEGVKVWALFLFVTAGQPMVEVGEYPTIKDCRDAVDTSWIKSEVEDNDQRGEYAWRQPFQAQWACIPRPSRQGASRVGHAQ
jgi:SH3-like domain-containing protein